VKFSPKQCDECPFRPTALPGWLGSYDVGSVASSIWKGQPFFCHTTINYERKDWEKRAMESGKLCTGSLVFAHKMHAPENEIQIPQVRNARLAVLKVADQVECMSPREFMDHHTNTEASFAKLEKLGVRRQISRTAEFPSFDPDETMFEFTKSVLDSAGWNHLEKLLGSDYLMDIGTHGEEIGPGMVSEEQLRHIANMPWELLEPHASAILLAIDKLGQSAFVPFDNMKRARDGER
jgi:hypothetical protein